MDLLEASARLERIELLAKISHFDEVTLKDKTVALEWIGEMVEALRKEVCMARKDTHCEDIIRIRCDYQ
ncbi:hypothetical protein EDF76_3052 [Raoultella terrigena]|nr:hypothetical protein EDF76_3052 [Raoultella terrigena]